MTGEGRIITIPSSTTALMLPGYAVYDATKGAVEQFTRILSKEFGERRITVNAVSPGATETETYRIGKSEEFPGQLEAMSAFGRLGQAGEIAAVVSFLASGRLGHRAEHPGQRRHRLTDEEADVIFGGRNPEPDRAGADPAAAGRGRAAAHPDPLVRTCQPMVIPPGGCERAPCGRAHQTGDVGVPAAARRPRGDRGHERSLRGRDGSFGPALPRTVG